MRHRIQTLGLQGFKLGLPLLLVLGSLGVAPIATANYRGNLTIQVNGLRNQKGLLCLALFGSSRGFPSSGENAVKSQCVKIGDNPLKLTVNNLNSGSYAIAIYHDQNGDRTLNRNFLGIPTEGFGFSNNPTIRQGPPRFGEAAFLLAGPNTQVAIQMQYVIN